MSGVGIKSKSGLLKMALPNALLLFYHRQ